MFTQQHGKIVIIRPMPGLIEVEPVYSDISPRAVNKGAYLPSRERDTMVDKEAS